jgi:hypothetical protein
LAEIDYAVFMDYFQENLPGGTPEVAPNKTMPRSPWVFEGWSLPGELWVGRHPNAPGQRTLFEKDRGRYVLLVGYSTSNRLETTLRSGAVEESNTTTQY